jgi:rhodanese-related sulfurtransferase
MKTRMHVSLLALVLVFSPLVPAFAQNTKPIGPPAVVLEMVEKAKAAIQVVSLAEVKEALDKKEKAVFLDVRDSWEYAGGHLPGAINISRGTLEFKVWSLIPDPNTKVYVYCQTAMRSALATKTLNDLDYKQAVLMDAQFEEWINAGYPVVK